MRTQNRKLLPAILAGFAGGLAGAFAMNRFQALASPRQPEPPPEQEAEDATMKTAEAIVKAVTGHGLSKEQKKKAGPLVHYLYGATIGAIYGAMVWRFRAAAAGFGTAYGAAAWALGDEIAVPALKLGGKPGDTPLAQHLQALAAHLVYGATLEGVRRLSVKG